MGRQSRVRDYHAFSVPEPVEPTDWDLDDEEMDEEEKELDERKVAFMPSPSEELDRSALATS